MSVDAAPVTSGTEDLRPAAWSVIRGALPLPAAPHFVSQAQGMARANCPQEAPHTECALHRKQPEMGPGPPAAVRVLVAGEPPTLRSPGKSRERRFCVLPPRGRWELLHVPTRRCSICLLQSLPPPLPWTPP